MTETEYIDVKNLIMLQEALSMIGEIQPGGKVKIRSLSACEKILTAQIDLLMIAIDVEEDL